MDSAACTGDAQGTENIGNGVSFDKLWPAAAWNTPGTEWELTVIVVFGNAIPTANHPFRGSVPIPAPAGIAPRGFCRSDSTGPGVSGGISPGPH